MWSGGLLSSFHFVGTSERTTAYTFCYVNDIWIPERLKGREMVLFHKNVFVREWTRRMVFPLHLILPSIRPIAYTLIAGMRAIHLLLEQNEIPFRPYHAYIIDKNYRFLCHFYGNESFTCESLLLRLYSEQYITISYWNRMNKIWY